MDASIAKEDMTVYDLAILMMQGFDRIDRKFHLRCDLIESKIEKLENKFDKLDRHIRYDHEARLLKIEGTLDL